MVGRGIADNLSLIPWNLREVRSVSRASTPIHMIVHYPKTEEGKLELARRVSDVHADMVHQTIQRLNCPSEQKLELLDAVIATAKKKAGEQAR